VSTCCDYTGVEGGSQSAEALDCKRSGRAGRDSQQPQRETEVRDLMSSVDRGSHSHCADAAENGHAPGPVLVRALELEPGLGRGPASDPGHKSAPYASVVRVAPVVAERARHWRTCLRPNWWR
jgi:hypothetical protein